MIFIALYCIVLYCIVLCYMIVYYIITFYHIVLYDTRTHYIKEPLLARSPFGIHFPRHTPSIVAHARLRGNGTRANCRA